MTYHYENNWEERREVNGDSEPTKNQPLLKAPRANQNWLHAYVRVKASPGIILVEQFKVILDDNGKYTSQVYLSLLLE